MNRKLLFAVVTLLSTYLFVLGWSGLEFAAYSSGGSGLFLESMSPRHLALGKPESLELIGGGFDSDTRVFMHMDVDNQDAVVGSLPLESVTHDLELVGDTLFVAGNGTGLTRIDVSDPLKPKIHRFSTLTTTPVLDINRHGDNLYLSCAKHGVEIFQVDNQGEIINRNRLNTWSMAVASEVIGDFLYVAANLDGLLIYALNDTQRKAPVATVNPGFPIRSIEAFGDYLYVAAGKAGVIIYRVDENGMLKEVGRLPVDRTARSITVNTDNLYLLESGRISQFSLADPQFPKLVASQAHLSLPQRLYHAGDSLYVADNLSGLGVIDNRSGYLPATAKYASVGGNPRGMVVIGDYLYVAVANKQLKIIDPKKILPRQVLAAIETQSNIGDLLVSAEHLFFTDRKALYVKALKNPERPVKQISEGEFISILHAGAYVFAPKLGNSVEVFDVSDMDTPRRVTDWPELAATQLLIAGDYLIAARGVFGLSLFKLKGLEQPQLLERVDEVSARQVFLHDGLVVVAGEKDGLHLYRIDNDRLLLVGKMKLPFPLDVFSGPIALQVVGNTVFATNGEGGLMLIDISNPASPKLVSSLPLPGFSVGLQVKGDKVFVTSRYSGIHTVDVSNQNSPRLLDAINVADVSGSVQYHNGTLYIGNEMMGIAVVPEPVELEVDRFSAGKLRVTVPPFDTPGRYSLQVSTQGDSAVLGGVLRFQ